MLKIFCLDGGKEEQFRRSSPSTISNLAHFMRTTFYFLLDLRDFLNFFFFNVEIGLLLPAPQTSLFLILHQGAAITIGN